jgi:hypothetical protein
VPWLGRWTAADPAGLRDGTNVFAYTRGNPVAFSDPTGHESAPFAKPGTADYSVGTKTDAELYRSLKGMSAEQRGEFRGGATGAFRARVQAFLTKYNLEVSITIPEVTIEGKVPELDEPPDAPERVYSNEELRDKVPIIPFFVRDYHGGYGWLQYVRANQDLPEGAPRGLRELRALSGGGSLAVAQFSRNQAPGTSIEDFTLRTVEAGGAAVSALSAGARLSASLPKLFTVDKTMQAADEAAGVLVKGKYIKNPTAKPLAELITETGKVGGKKMSGQFMYVIDESGKITIGTRAGQRMPHPTLVGGANPRVQAAGIVDIRGGRIFSINTASGHFKPGHEALEAAGAAFGKLPEGAFHPAYKGVVLH